MHAGAWWDTVPKGLMIYQACGLDTKKELLKTKEILDLIGTEIKTKDSTANGFRVCEKIWKFALLPNSFTVGEELSAKQEMMRYKIVEKYADVIKPLFEN